MQDECYERSKTVVKSLPSTEVLHPLSGNIVYQETIYDTSYTPPKPIGTIQVVYEKNGDVQFDPLSFVLELLPIPKNALDVFDLVPKK